MDKRDELIGQLHKEGYSLMQLSVIFNTHYSVIESVLPVSGITEKHLVSFYWGTYVKQDGKNPDTMIKVEVPYGSTRNTIILEGLKMYNKAYPRTYYAEIEKIS